MEKWAKSWAHNAQNDFKMAFEHMKIYSRSLIIREIQIKNTQRYHFLSIRLEKIYIFNNSFYW